MFISLFVEILINEIFPVRLFCVLSSSSDFICCWHEALFWSVRFYNRNWLPSSFGAEIKSWAQDMSSAVRPHIQPFNLTEIYSNVIDARKSPRMNSCVRARYVLNAFNIPPFTLCFFLLCIPKFTIYSMMMTTLFLFSIICFWNFNFPSILTCLHSNHCWSID